MMDGWDQSAGIRAEYVAFKAVSKPVVFWDPEKDALPTLPEITYDTE